MRTDNNSSRIFSAALLCLLVAAAAGCGGNGAWNAEGAGGGLERPLFEVRSEELNRRGVEAFRRGALDSARRLFAASLRVNRSADNRPGEVLDLINLGRVHIAMGGFDEAYAALDDAARLARAVGDRRLAGETHATIAKAGFMSGDYERALENIDESLKIDEDLGYKDIGAKLNLKALVLIEKGRPLVAMALLERSVKLSERNGDRATEANSLRAMAVLESGAGRPTSALGLFEAAYEIDAASGDTMKVAYGLERMAEIHYAAGRLEEAAFLLERSYKVNLSGGFSERAAADLAGLIKTCAEMGDGESAARWSETREEVLKETGSR